MASLKARATATVERLRARFPWFDHILRTVAHYNSVYGNAQAGAVTYFGFLSVFPILALAFFVVGRIARIYPDARDGLVQQINTALPGLVGEGAGQISLTTIEDYAGRLGLIGLAIPRDRGLGGHARAERSGHPPVRGARVALRYAPGARGHVRRTPGRAPEVRTGQVA